MAPSDFMVWNELESMAHTAQNFTQGEAIDEAAIQRWQGLFGYSRSEASQKLEEHRADISPHSVPDPQWNLVCAGTGNLEVRRTHC